MTTARGLADRRALAFVWAAWVTMVAAAVWCWLNATINIPLTEDWLLVPGLTGYDPHFWRSLWEQNNEHRAPLPRLVLTAGLYLARGNMRAGMALNVATLAVAAAVLLVALRVARGGVTRMGDALVPTLLLHLGNWENLFWAWQLTQVLPTAFLLLLIAIGLIDPTLSARWARFSATCLTVALPLCGGNGLAIAPFALAWLWWAGTAHRGLPRAGLWVGAASTALLGLVYFVGYQRPDWLPANPGIMPSLAAALQFVALGWGPVARSAWLIAAPAALLVIALGGWAGLRSYRTAPPTEQPRFALLLWWTVALGVFALAIGWSRAGAIDIYRLWPTRYALFSAPLVLVGYCQWSVGRERRPSRSSVAWAVVGGVLAPLNTVHGLEWAGFYRVGAESVLDGLKRHDSAQTLTARHRQFLHHSMDPTDLANGMIMLKAAGMWPWPLLPDTTTARPKGDDGAAKLRLKWVEFRYHNAAAKDVQLVWGVDGWWPLPASVRPVGTTIVDGLMRTPLGRMPDGWFAIRVQVPETASIEGGFAPVDSATGVAGWERNLAAKADTSTIVRDSAVVGAPMASRRGPLVPVTVRYRASFASMVLLTWGVDGWRPVPEVVGAGEAMIRDKVMTTPMRREGDGFIAHIRAPLGARLDYGFRVPERRGILDFISPQWEPGNDRPEVVAGAQLQVSSQLVVLDEIRMVRSGWRYLGGALGFCALAWALLAGLISARRDRFGDGDPAPLT